MEEEEEKERKARHYVLAFLLLAPDLTIPYHTLPAYSTLP